MSTFLVIAVVTKLDTRLPSCYNFVMKIDKPFPEIHIEKMTNDDLKQVMDIENDSFPDPWRISYYKRLLQLRKRHSHLFVARLDNEVIGYVVFYINCGEAHIMNIAVAAEHRRHGVGRTLMLFALDIIKTNDADVIYLEVAVNNSAACQLYREFGFEVYGRRKRYYRNGGDAYVMRKHLQH